MIRFDKLKVSGFEEAIRAMRNPMDSWAKSDSSYGSLGYNLGTADKELALRLAKGGPVHAKYRRMIVVYVDITAPLYWWKEFDTYKVGTVANSCSTMHTLHKRRLDIKDFSCEHLYDYRQDETLESPLVALYMIINIINKYRDLYVATNDKEHWWQMIQLLPSSYNQTRTVMMNYEVLHNIYRHRRFHKLDEWDKFCKFIELLPHSELIVCKEEV